jgi:hypothetical protein
LQALLQRQVWGSIQNQPPVRPQFSEMTRTCLPQVSQVTYHWCTTLLRWRPSGIAEFSILSNSNFSITCSDISLVSFCVYSMSPGQFMHLFLAFSLKSFWESQHEAGVGESKLGCLIFCHGISISFWLLELEMLKCSVFTQYIYRGKSIKSLYIWVIVTAWTNHSTTEKELSCILPNLILTIIPWGTFPLLKIKKKNDS